MQNPKKRQRVLTIYGSFMAVCSLLVLGGILLSPSEPGNTILFGLSTPRLIFALGLLVIFFLFAFIATKSIRNRDWAEKIFNQWFGKSRFSDALVWISGISFGLGWIGTFVPAYRLGRFENYWIRIQPAMIFLLLASAATLIVFFMNRGNISFADLKSSKTLRRTLWLFILCSMVLGLMLYSRFGMYSRDDFWYGAGVPVLVPQLLGAILGGTIFFAFEKKIDFKHRDLVMFLLIFGITAFLWAREPLQKGFSFIGPYPPNKVLYPFYDAAIFDEASQFALIGQRLIFYGGYFIERPLYLSFLVYLHGIFGQDYIILMAVQAAMFAILPALIYMIGKTLNMRAVGFATALIAMFRGINSIAASNMLDTATPKMMLTDFPAAIGITLIVWLTCEWLKSPAKKWMYAVWIGGTLGLTLMIRTNALLLLALIPLYALFIFRVDWKKWLSHSFLIVLAVIAITLPWELRNRSLGIGMYEPILAKFRSVILQRYSPPDESGISIGESKVTLKSWEALSVLYAGNGTIQPGNACDSVACFVPNHFLHDIVTSILVLPTSPSMEDLRHTVKVNNPYWHKSWKGTFAASALFFFLLNLFLILLGIMAFWERSRFLGIAPLAIFMFYNLSNAFARTSGGRYIVPIDWILTLYFLMGIFQIIILSLAALGNHWQLESEPNELVTNQSRFISNKPLKAIIALFILVGIGILVPLSEHLYPKRYENLDIKQTLMSDKQKLDTAGLDLNSLEAFLKNGNAAALVGRALYPRHFVANQGEAVFYPNLPLDFPRTTFDLIGPDGGQGVILPGDIHELPHASDVIVIGCKEKDYFDALAVILLDENGSIYTREPAPVMQCPLQQPD